MKIPVASVLTLFLATAVLGCSIQRTGIAPQMAPTPARPLPFKGRLVDGDPGELPPAVAMSLSNGAAVAFSYREELTHDEHHVPLAISALDPATYAGASLGSYGVTAFASLSIIEGDKVLGDYTAKAYVAKSYSLYAEPTHRELEQAARAAVREQIDEKLYRDADRLAQTLAGRGTTPGGSVSK